MSIVKPKEPRRVSASRLKTESGEILPLSRVSGGMYIYLITNTVNGKQYVGRSIRSNPDKRWNEHRYRAKSPEAAIHLAIRKYGVERFTFEVIDHASDAEALAYLESRHITERNTMSPKGYNLEVYQPAGRLRSEDSKERSAASRQGVSGRTDKTSRFCGVVNHPSVGWRVNVKRGGRVYSKGFDTEEECALHYDRFVLAIYGENARLNFPERRAEHTKKDMDETVKRLTTPMKTSSRYRHVTFARGLGKWIGKVLLADGSRRSRRTDSEIEAAEFVDVVRVLFRGETDRLNFPDKLEAYLKLTHQWFDDHCGIGAGGITKTHDRYIVRLTEQGKRVFIGLYDSHSEARRALEQARIERNRHWHI